MKKLPAMISAAVVTAVIALGMLAIGWNAWFNSARAAAAAPVGQPAAAVTNGSNSEVGQVQRQLADQQAQIQALRQQLDASNQQVQQLQSILNALQQRGIIRVNSDGSVTLGQSGGRSER